MRSKSQITDCVHVQNIYFLYGVITEPEERKIASKSAFISVLAQEDW